MITRLYFFIAWLLLIAIHPIPVKSQSCYWSKQISGNNYDGAGNIAFNTDGSVFISGSTQSYNLYFQNDTLHSEFFLAKYDEAGNEMWAKGLNAVLVRLIIDPARNCLITAGYFPQSCYFEDTLISGIGMILYLMKLDLDGNIIWVRTADGPGADYCTDVNCDPSGNIFLAGCNSDSIRFDNTTIIPPGGFIAKYSNDGNVLWAKKKFRKYSSSYPISEVETESILATNNGIYINGTTHNDTILVDTITAILQTSFSACCLAGFSSEGDAQWVNIFGLPESQSGLSLAADPQGGFYTTGRFFNTGFFGIDTLTGSPGGDCFIAKHGPDGEIEWVGQLNVTDEACGLTLASDSSNFVYLFGVFSGTASFGNFSLTSDSLDEAFVARYDNSGNCMGAFSLPNVQSAIVAIDPEGNLGMTGSFIHTATIGPNTFTSRGGLDAYVAKCGPMTDVRTIENLNRDRLIIYANPNSGRCSITIPDDLFHETNLKLSIYDSKGRLIKSFRPTVSENNIILNLTTQAAGIYNAVLTNGKKSYSGKIILTRNQF
jgi:hypothetical protein